MLEVVRVQLAVVERDVRLDVVRVLDDFERIAMLGKDILRLGENLSVRSRRRAHLDDRVAVRRVRNLDVRRASHWHNRTTVGSVDEVAHLSALQRGNESLDLGAILVAVAHGHHVGVLVGRFGVGGLFGERRRSVDACADGIVAVNHAHVHIGERARHRCRFGLDDVDVVGILLDVVLRGRQSRAVLQRDEPLILKEQQGTCFIRRIRRDGDLLGSRSRRAAARQRNRHRTCDRRSSDRPDQFRCLHIVPFPFSLRLLSRIKAL